MKPPLSRRDFVKATVLGSAALPLALRGQAADSEIKRPGPEASENKGLPKGRIGNVEITGLIMGGNLIAGYAHARQLSYVSPLMRRYNTPTKIRQTIELGEQQGINAIESWAMDDNSALFDHWKAGGKIQWIAQVRLGAMWGNEGGFSQIDKAINDGAVAVHLTGDAAESLLDNGQFDRVGEAIQYIQGRKVPAGVAAHDLRVILECEKRKFNADFYQKTLHPADYFGGPKPGDPDRVGKFDNSWCSDAQAVIDTFAKITKPLIAFKVLAAGGLLPRAGFPFAINGGADFILVGMFDWQVEENVKLAQRVFRVAMGPGSKRTRPWGGGNGTT